MSESHHYRFWKNWPREQPGNWDFFFFFLKLSQIILTRSQNWDLLAHLVLSVRQGITHLKIRCFNQYEVVDELLEKVSKLDQSGPNQHLQDMGNQ